MDRTGSRFRHLGVVVAGIMMTLSLAAWGGSSSSQKTTLTLLSYFTSGSPCSANCLAEKQIVAKFEKNHPGVTVKIVAASETSEFAKFQAMTSAGTAPNVFHVDNPYIPELFTKGVLSSVNYQAAGYKNEHDFRNAYVHGALQGYQYKGKDFGIPVELSDYGMWANTNEYQAAGLSVPTTWAQVCQDGPAMTKMSGSKVTQEELAIPTNLSGSQFLVFDAIASEFGSPIINTEGNKSFLDSKPAIQALTMMQNLVYTCHASYPALNSSQPGGDRLAYEAGQAAMLLTGGSWFTGGLQTTYKSLAPPVSQPFPYPTQPGHAPVSLNYGAAYTVPASAPNQKLSWELAGALGNAGITWFKASGLYNGQKSVSNSQVAKSFPYWSKVWAPGLAHSTYEGSLLNGNQIDDIIGSAMDQALENHADVASTLKAANAQVVPLLNKKPL